jgi:hypothetical protein
LSGSRRTAQTCAHPGTEAVLRIRIRARDAPDTGTVFAGYPANPKVGYRISGRILGLTAIFLVKYLLNKLIKNSFKNYIILKKKTQPDLVTKFFLLCKFFFLAPYLKKN